MQSVVLLYDRIRFRSQKYYKRMIYARYSLEKGYREVVTEHKNRAFGKTEGSVLLL